MGGGVKNVKKMTPLFLGGGSKIMNLFFLDFEPRNCFRAPTSWGLYGAEGDEPLCTFFFCHFYYIDSFCDDVF